MKTRARDPSFREAITGSGPVVRPPWSSEHSVRAACTSCGDCIRACPQGILREGPARTPVIDFSTSECTFCRKCAEACGEDVFEAVDTAPWALVAQIDAGCMLMSGIGCQLCTDICDRVALRLDLSHRPMGRIVVDQASCTGCGACVATCPVDAISMEQSDSMKQSEAAHV